MIITCPACSTRYTIDAVHLGAGGRLVRCSACGEQWPARTEAPRPESPRSFAAPPPAAPPAVAPAVAAAPPPPPPPPIRTPVEAPPPSLPEPAVEDAVVPAAVYEEEAEEEEERAAEAPQAPLSQDELDAMFAEPAPVESLVDEEEDDSEDVEEPDDLPEPEPIPQVFTDPSSVPDDDEEERSGSALLVALIALLVIAGIAGGLYFARDGVMAMVPASRTVYDLIGLGGDRLGAGLEIRNVLSERETENNTDVLVVRGTIANVDQKQRPIPLIRVVLYDGGSNPLQDMVMPPLKPELDAGENIGFRARLVDPSPLARRIEVTFAEAPPQPKS